MNTARELAEKICKFFGYRPEDLEDGRFEKLADTILRAALDKAKNRESGL